jgi:DUF2075 family protein
MLSSYYAESISVFCGQSPNEVVGIINSSNAFDGTMLQQKSWESQITLLQETLSEFEGTIFFEFSIPRMGKRVDVLLLIQDVVFVVEFKVGESNYASQHVEQVWDYSLDLKNFHAPSHRAFMVPVLVATHAKPAPYSISTTSHQDNLFLPIRCNQRQLRDVLKEVLAYVRSDSKPEITSIEFARGQYHPTPTIIEAAVSLYNNHSVEAITRSDAGAQNLTVTTGAISDIIQDVQCRSKKAIVFVTGVPGAGKTLVGLKVATQHLDEEAGNTSVYLSGNAPLVAILQEALTRDRVLRESEVGRKMTKTEARQAVKSFIQIIHHYRDAYLVSPEAPYDHVAIFDEAQRAWNKEQTVKFMRMKKNRPDFDHSEPAFLISCLDRHPDWAVVVCLVGGGQEINTGEGGIKEWLQAIQDEFPSWEVFVSPHLTDQEYDAVDALEVLKQSHRVEFNECLHLRVSMRSFRAENLSLFVKQILDLNPDAASQTLRQLCDKYPIVITRDLDRAKAWLKEKARGSERYGMVVSSQAQRLKPLAIDVKSPMNPVNWFLDGKDDVRSSYFLEDVATEFHVQGLELDWACVVWDGDLRYSPAGWKTFAFKGNKWQNIHHPERKKYLINAYRVLLTRARQGMVIVVPAGSSDDHTRQPEFYNDTFNYLQALGLEVLS